MAERIPAVDSVTYRFPSVVRAQLAKEMSDPSTEVGGELIATIDAAPDGRGFALGKFDPRRDLPRCRVWLDASTLSGADGSKIVLWGDGSGFGSDVYQSTASAQPTLAVGAQNGLNVVRTDASSFLFRADTLFGAGIVQPAGYAQPNTLIAVAKIPAVARTGNSVLFGSAPSGQNHLLIDSNGSMLLFAGSGTPAGGPNINDGIWHVIVGVFDVTSFALYIDGYLVATHTVQSQGSGLMKGIAVGADAGGSSKLGSADIGELIMCADRLGYQEALSVTRTLAEKWGI